MTKNNIQDAGMPLERLNITIPKDTKKKLETLANDEKRSQSNMITILIEERYTETHKD